MPFAFVVTYGSNARCSTVVGKAGAGIGKRERDLVALALQRDVVTRARPFGLGVDGVLQEVVEHLAQAGGLALDDERLGRKRQRDVRAQIVVQREHVEQEGAEVHRLHVPGRGCRA